MFQTEHEFTLPKGYVDSKGNLHSEGTMRLATAADEILPLKDPRVEQNPAYLVVILLSRVITSLGDLKSINPKVIEGLFSEDLEHLENLYNAINGHAVTKVTECPECNCRFEVENFSVGG